LAHRTLPLPRPPAEAPRFVALQVHLIKENEVMRLAELQGLAEGLLFLDAR
jgi:hypothetical protein